MNKEERLAITKLIREFADILHEEGQPLPPTDLVQHTINTTDEIPVYTKNYRYPTIFKDEVKQQIDKMLQQDIIRPSNSPWNSPIWIVPKKLDNSGKRKFRLVTDFRLLNKKTVDDRYPLPNINDILDKIGKC